MATVLDRVGTLLGRKAESRAELSAKKGTSRDGSLRMVNEGDGRYELVELEGLSAATPDRRSQYLYFAVASELRARLTDRLVIEIDYLGKSFGTFRLQYSSTDPSAPYEGRYKEAEQFWSGTETAEPTWKRCPPSLVLADEPTDNLDSRSSEEIVAILQSLNREQGLTVVVVTHEPDIGASTQRIITTRDGIVVSDEPVENQRVALAGIGVEAGI